MKNGITHTWEGIISWQGSHSIPFHRADIASSVLGRRRPIARAHMHKVKLSDCAAIKLIQVGMCVVHRRTRFWRVGTVDYLITHLNGTTKSLCIRLFMHKAFVTPMWHPCDMLWLVLTKTQRCAILLQQGRWREQVPPTPVLTTTTTTTSNNNSDDRHWRRWWQCHHQCWLSQPRWQPMLDYHKQQPSW